MPRKTIVRPSVQKVQKTDDDNRPKILFIEDGQKETNRILPIINRVFSCQRVETGPEASVFLNKYREIQAIILTMNFPYINPDYLVGMEDIVIKKFDGDIYKARDFLRENQGTFIMNHIRKRVPTPVPIIFLHDFSTELQRWDSIAQRYENVYYVTRDMGALDIVDLLKTITEGRK